MRIYTRKSEKAGFTLLELSVVILVIGLLVGGIMVADELINASRIRTLATEAVGYRTSIALFKDKFGKLPGDFNNASGLLGCATGSVPTGCNGNGNGHVQWGGSNPVGQGDEIIRSWQHMSLAKLVAQDYSGVRATQSYLYPNVSAPSAKGTDKGVYWIHDNNPWIVAQNAYISYLYLGAWEADGYGWGALLSGSDLKSLDLKIDNGMPTTGVMSSGCYTGTGATATYQSTNAICGIFLLGLDK